MSGSMLIIPLMPDTEQATKALQDWANEMEGKIKIKAPVLGGTPSGGGGLDGGIGAAQKDFAGAAASLKKIELAEEIEKIRGVYNDARDVFDITTVSLLGFAEAEQTAASETAYLAEKAVMVGLGIGGLPGLVVGAGLGLAAYAHWNVEAAKRTTELTTKLREAQKDFRSLQGVASQLGASTFDFSDATRSLEAQTKAIADLRKSLPTDRDLAAIKSMAEDKSAFSLDKEGKLKEYERQKNLIEEVSRAEAELAASTGAYYAAGLARSQEFNDSIEHQLELNNWIGESRPLANIEKDLDAANKRYHEMAEAAAIAQAKAREVSEAVNSGDVVKLANVALKYNINLLKDRDKVLADAEKAESAWGAALKTVTGLLNEHSRTQEENQRKAKEAAEKAGQTLIKSLQKQNKEAEKEFKRYVEPRAAQMIKEYDEFTKQQDAIGEYEANAYVKREELGAAFASAQEEHEWRVFWTKQEIAEKEKALREKERQETAQHYEEIFGYATEFLGGFTAQLEDNLSAGRGAFERMGLAAQKGVATVLKALGKKWAITATAELAEAFSWLGVPGGQENAAEHFASAALYGSAAAAAGVGGAIIGGRAAAKEDRLNEQERDASGGGFGGGGTAGRVADSGPTELPPVTVYLGGGPGSTTLYAGNGAEAKAQAGMLMQDAIDAARRAGPRLGRHR